MPQAFEAAIDERGQVRLAKDIDLPVSRRAIVIVLDEPPANVRDAASVPKLKYTKKQGQYLAFIHHYTVVHSRPPAESDLQAFFGVTPPTVHQMILRQPLLHIRRQQEQLVRLVRLKASLILHAQIMTPEVTIATISCSESGSPTDS